MIFQPSYFRKFTSFNISSKITSFSFKRVSDNGFLEGKTNVDATKLLIDRPHFSFMKFNAIIFRIKNIVTETELSFLKQFAISDNTFKNSPDWIKSWAHIILKTILKEKNVLYHQILNCSPDVAYSELSENQKAIKSEIEDLYYQRIHNFLVTIDKVQHFLSNQKDLESLHPPIKFMEDGELLQFYRTMLMDLIEKMRTNQQWPDTQNNLDTFLDKYFPFSEQKTNKAKTGFEKNVKNEENKVRDPFISSKILKNKIATQKPRKNVNKSTINFTINQMEMENDQKQQQEYGQIEDNLISEILTNKKHEHDNNCLNNEQKNAKNNETKLI